MRQATLLLLIGLCATTAHAALDDMIPAARQVEMLADTAPVADGIILVPPDTTSKTNIAAAEINSRLQGLGAKALPVHSIPDLDPANLGPRTVVIIASATGDASTLTTTEKLLGESLKITADDPGPQGYVIRCARREDGGLTCALVGSDAQGMLYAAVTFRHMLEPGEDGVVVRPANVRDWPDFKTRNLGVPFEETLRDPWASMHSAAQKGDVDRANELAVQHVAKIQRYVDWLLRHKINMMGAHGAWSGGWQGTTSWERGIIRRINEYAKQRGITAVYGDNISIGSYPQDKDNPDFADIVMHTSHKRYFCWSRLEYHRKKAAEIAGYMKECGYGALYLHDVDGGGWQNPALWNDRCELCRKTYGDDHAKADAVVFGTYYDALREAIPDAKFLAVIYPYSCPTLNPESIKARLQAQMGDVPGVDETATRIALKHRDFLKRLNSLVPEDWYICIRESERENVDLMREAWGKHAFYTYFEYTRWRSWQPWFSTTPRMTGTFYYLGYDDILFGSIPGWGFRNPLRLYAAETAWNSRGEGYETYTGQAWHDYTQCQSPPELARRWALRTATDLWGAEVAPYTVPLFSLNLATNFIFNTDAVADRAGIQDVPSIMKEQFEATVTCADSMQALFDRILAGEIKPKELFFGELTNYYHFAVAAKVLAGYKYQKAGVQEAIILGDQALGEARIAALQDSLEAWRQDLAFVRERTKGLPMAERYCRKTVAKGYLLALNVDELQEDLQKLLDRREELFAAYNIPKWFRDSASKREFHATRAEGPIVLDGKLDEPVWQRAEPIEHFVQYDQLRLASRETVARVAYDDANLYVAFECFDPSPQEIEIPRRDRDQFEQVDSVEVFLDSNNDDETFRHYYVDLGGNVFDAARAKQPDGTLKYTRAWNGNMRHALARLPDRWIAELAIPATDLDGPPKTGATWGLHVARNIVHGRPELENVAPQFLAGESFHTVAKYASLRLEGPESRIGAPKVTLEVLDKSLAQKVHEEGDSTEARFNLRITTDRSLHNVKVIATLLDADGKQVLRKTVLAQPWLELLWQSRRPIFLEVKRAYEGLLLHIELTADEGRWEQRNKLGKYRAAAPSEDEMYAPGQAGAGDRALAATVFCPAFDYIGDKPRHFVPSAQGAIECWLCPTEDVIADRDAERLMRTIVDIGPVRYDHPYLTNHRTIAIYINKYAQLVFTITNSQYRHRSVQYKVEGWKAGQWRHVACQWKLDDGGECKMQIFVDGKLRAQKVNGDRHGPGEEALPRKDEMLPIQIGAMNTGVGQARMLIDELRFSLAPPYEAEFDPPNRLTADDLTSLLFHFDGGLKPESALQDLKVTAMPGAVG